MKKYIYGIILVLIILLNLFLRVYGLNKSPASVNFDEAALGYNAYSILKTGRDEYGNFLPISLRSFNDYKPALYAYLSIPFIAVMGLDAASTRMVSALAGTVSLVFLYFFIREFVENRWLRLFIFLVISLEPWRLHFSRTAFESNLSMCFFIAGAWFLYKYRDWKNEKNITRKFLLISTLMSLSAYSYHGARLAIPMLLGMWAIDPLKIFFEKKVSKYFVWVWKKKLFGFVPLIMFIVLVLPVFLANQSSLLLTRFRQENVFSRYSPYTPRELITSENAWQNWQNHPIYYFLGIMSGHVLSYISPVNLTQRVYHWVRGGVQYIPEFSMLGWLETVFFVFGFVVLVSGVTTSFKYRYVVYWIIAGAAPAALTWNWFHPLRSLNLFPALEIIVVLGFVYLFELGKKILPTLVRKIIFTGLGLILVLSLLFVVCNEYGYAVWSNHGEYQPGGFKEGMPILKSIQGNYDKVIIDSPHAQSYIFFLFYQSFDPKVIQKYADVRPAPGIEGSLNFNFDKYVFEKYDWPQQRDFKKTIFWTSSEVKEEEINNTKGAKLIWVSNAVSEKATAIIIKD